MRVLTFSVLRNCKFKRFPYQVPKLFSSDSAPSLQTKADVEKSVDPPGSLLELLPSWPASETEIRAELARDMRVLPDFISEEEETELMAELDPYLKKMRYEFDHWDDAIHGFRETERRSWSPRNAVTLARVLPLAFPSAGAEAGAGGGGAAPLPHQHVLDLAPAGHIKPHVDAVRFCGDVIAGVCLLSAAVMRLVHTARPELAADVLLPRRALYVMSGTARYSFSHAVLGGDASWFRGARVRRLRRVSVIARSRPRPGQGDAPPAAGGDRTRY